MNQVESPRVRFAPSPTGFLHVGGARTALFNYLYAQRERGVFLLRIEDTDRERSSSEMTEQILASMAWLGLDVSEPVVHQADGLERHRRAAGRLLETGHAYPCFLSSEQIAERRELARSRGEMFRYRSLRKVTPEAEDRVHTGDPYALLFRVPEGETVWDDAVHGEMRFANADVDDFIVLRSDGTPVYQLAVVSDDIEMSITHVIRGDDHISNTPRQMMVYEALAARPPVFAHVPMILGTDGKRLSKRHGATSVEAYREQGIRPEAMVNFLALLGWSPGGDREVMDLPEMIEAFSLDRILKKSAVFDPAKLQWLNGRHLSRMRPEQLLAEVQPRLLKLAPVAAEDVEHCLAVIDLVKERARTNSELVRQAAPFFVEALEYDEAAVHKHWKDPAATRERLTALSEMLDRCGDFGPESLERELRALAVELEIGAGKLIHPLRVALVGMAVSPGIFEVLSLMGHQRSLTRVRQALEFLAGVEPSDASGAEG